MYGFAIEPNWIEVTRHNVSLPVKNRLRILHLSDLHIQDFGSREKRVLEIAGAEKPDLIAITGDHVTRNPNVEAIVTLIASLKAPLGVWIAWGNWEHSRPSDLEQRLSALANVHVLINRAEMAAPGLSVIGIDDLIKGNPNAQLAFAAADPSSARLLIFHSPEQFGNVKDRFELALAGHTHGGQIRIPFLPPLWLPPGSGDYVSGWYGQDGRKMYVSRGIGTSLLPVRFFCRPEIAVITVQPDFP